TATIYNAGALIRETFVRKIALKFERAVCRYSRCRNGTKIILLRAYKKKRLSSPDASQKADSGTALNRSIMERQPARRQCSTREAVTTDLRSPGGTSTNIATKGFLINPLRTVSRMAVTLVNNTHTPMSSLGSILTKKKRLRKPK